MITLSVGRDFPQTLSRADITDLIVRIKAVVYARVSTQDQAKHGYSLESQVERSAALAKSRYGIDGEEVMAIIEEGEMGDNPDRPSLNYALWLLEQGVGSKFIVLHPDRLARSLNLQLHIVERIWGSGAEFVCVEVEVDPDNPQKTLMFNMQGAIAQYNKSMILANSKRGRMTKVKNGKIPGIRRVFGYQFDKENDTLVENPAEKESYLLMVDWILNGRNGAKMNLTNIARQLSIMGVPAPSGDKWYQATVSRILKNPIYTGKFYYGKTEIKQSRGKKSVIKKPENEWLLVEVPKFIDDDTFDRLQKRLDTFVRKNRGAKPKTSYLLKGLVRCGRCGAAVVAGPPSRNKKTNEIMHHYYTCSGKGRKIFEVGTGKLVKSCRGRNWRKDIIDDYVWKYLVHCLRHPDDVLEQISQTLRDTSNIQKLETERDRLKASIDEKQSERKRWIQLHVKGHISDDEVEAELIPLQQDIDQLSENLQIVTSSLNAVLSDEQQIDLIRQQIEAFKSHISNDISDEDKRKYVLQLVKYVVLHDDSIEIHTAWDFSNDSTILGLKTNLAHSAVNGSNNSNHRQGDGMKYYISSEIALPSKRQYAKDYRDQTYHRYVSMLPLMEKLYSHDLLSFEEIGSKTGVPWWAIKKLFSAHGISRISAADRAAFKRQNDFPVIYRLHYEERKTFAQIGQAIGRSSTYIRQVLLENGCTPINYGQAQWRTTRLSAKP